MLLSMKRCHLPLLLPVIILFFLLTVPRRLSQPPSLYAHISSSGSRPLHNLPTIPRASPLTSLTSVSTTPGPATSSQRPRTLPLLLPPRLSLLTLTSSSQSNPFSSPLPGRN